MTLFSRQSRIPALVLLSLTAIIASTVLISSSDDADARHRRGHRARIVRPPRSPLVALPAVPPLPMDNPRAAAPDAPKPAEKPADEIQKADPQTTPLPEQKPIPETKPAEKPKEPPKPDEQLGPNPLPKEGAAGRDDHEESVEKADPSISPDRVYQNACPALMNGEVKGEIISPLSEGMCGERSPLKITAIGKDNPVKLTAPITTNCAMAGSLANWVVEVQKDAQANFGAEIESITTGSDYQCRKVNNGHKGRVSEHAFANAVDIVSFKFKNGKTTELGSGWRGKPEEQTFWRALHKASCDRFMTVIGPDGDAAHQGNLHLDLGCHGRKCEARICQ
ncbi:extensin family protein [Phyllobacterium zundukense]|uniref:Extensin family protein n=1 Tax=Phyllobacterium zundukense TaxID=1867719 RepID=A0ACD4D238_9HYPH|nr:extensin family protein [Phyllobacterium zundukense]UXN59881.1 extensin family protein [Phyllobacterium zundukense]